ncbi:MAG: ABC transporter permease [Planctomycetota bacterium]
MMLRQLPFEYAYRNLGRSRVRLIASVLGATLVVLLVLAAAGFVRGMQLTLTRGENLHENVIIMSTGSEEALERSQIDASVAGQAIASIPGLVERGGVVFASPEINIALPINADASDTTPRQAVIRGVRPVAFLVHSTVEIIEGRQPRAGQDEIIVGSLAATRLGLPDDRLTVGQTLWFDNRDWTIVGRFQAPNTVMDAEVWMPIIDLQIATKRDATISAVVVSLDSASFSDVDLFAKSRLDLEVTAMREADYYASIAAFYRPIRIMVIVTATLIAIGGLLGGLNTMYASFAARVREIGTLQSFGYTRPAIVTSLTEESLFAAAIGTVIGAILGLALLDGLAVKFSMGAFALTLDAPVVLTGIAGGIIVGLVGAVPPAIRCLRLPIPQALKMH